MVPFQKQVHPFCWRISTGKTLAGKVSRRHCTSPVSLEREQDHHFPGAVIQAFTLVIHTPQHVKSLLVLPAAKRLQAPYSHAKRFNGESVTKQEMCNQSPKDNTPLRLELPKEDNISALCFCKTKSWLQEYQKKKKKGNHKQTRNNRKKLFRPLLGNYEAANTFFFMLALTEITPLSLNLHRVQ